jgi:glycosyltransferase A (GT-A) superfamily protein (DUF2064 family)/SAM-dependent methyltransferase
VRARAGADRAHTVIVLAKEPLPGLVKTRLHSVFTPTETAALAAASLADTQSAVRDSAASRRILAWRGNSASWDAGFEVTLQPPGSLNDRLAAAFALDGGPDRPAGPALLIGMDTPQVTPALLDSRWDGADAVLGLSDDGGFWAIGFRGAAPADAFRGIPMSTDRTGACQLARLTELGLSVRLLPPLRDIDHPADLDAVCYHHPELRVAHRYAKIIRSRDGQPPDRVFDDLYQSADATPLLDRSGPLHIDLTRWRAEADAADQLVVARCEAPIVDLGCGPGRMVRALQESGRATLGVDISSVAVAQSRAGGGLALRRHIAEPLPAEGRWGTALLLDGNIGIGGNVADLLDRCRQLVAPGGLIICEVDHDPDRNDIQYVRLSSDLAESVPFAWAAAGTRTVQQAAALLDLLVVEEWHTGGRDFIALRTSRVASPAAGPARRALRRGSGSLRQ